MTNEELKERLAWLITLRWIGIAGVIVVTHIVRAIAFLSFSLVPVYSIVGSMALYNLYFARRLKGPPQRFLALAVSQILLDQIALAFALYFSGGCDSPFIYFFIFHVVISGILLPPRYAIGFTALAALFPAGVMGLKHIGVLPHIGIFRDEPMIFTNLAVTGSYGASFIVTLVLTAYFVNYLSTRLRSSREDLKKSNIKLSTLLEATRLTTSVAEIEQILSRSLKTVLNQTRLRVRVVLLLEQEAAQRCFDYYRCDSYNCPAYNTETDCWRMSGTLCRQRGGPHASFDDKVCACASCRFLAGNVLGPRLAAGPGTDGMPDIETLMRALRAGQAIISGKAGRASGVPAEATNEIAIPLQAKQQIIAVLYLAPGRAVPFNDVNREFFRLLADVISAGIVNGKIYEDMEASYLQTVAALSNVVEAKDPYTGGHSERVAEIGARIADALRLNWQEKEYIKFAALLHDIGKVAIGKDILRKRDGLDEQEADAMRAHPDRGAQIIEPIRFLKPIQSAIRHHHENFDGTGYPGGLKGKDIPYKARIIKIADAWDAMTSERPYRPVLSVEEAKKELTLNSGIQFDPELVEVFLTIPFP